MPSQRITANIQSLLSNNAFVRSAKYDPRIILEHARGPHPLWLAELAISELQVSSASQVLDLGAGHGLASVFLAREFGCTVTAVDVAVDPSIVKSVAECLHVEHLVRPIQADSRFLPFSYNSFDIVISCNAYYLFGTDALYLGYLSDFIKPGGHIAVVNPGLSTESASIPEPLLRQGLNGPPLFDWSSLAFRSAEWWARHFASTPYTQVIVSETIDGGWDLFRRGEVAYCLWQGIDPTTDRTVQELEFDCGRSFALIKTVAQIGKPINCGQLFNPKELER